MVLRLSMLLLNLVRLIIDMRGGLLDVRDAVVRLMRLILKVCGTVLCFMCGMLQIGDLLSRASGGVLGA
jgi:hypothetical protein